MIDICLLGCGGMMPLHNRWLSSLLFKCNGKMILIDCGEGTQIPINMCGWGFKSIDAICLTHYHGDHIFGLPGLLLTMGNSGREEPLTIIGPPNLYDIIKGVTVAAPQLPFDINLIELSSEHEESVSLGNIIIHSLPVEHWIPCLAYSLEVKRNGKFDAFKAKSNKVPLKFWSKLQNGEKIQQGNIIYTPDMVLGEARRGLKVTYCTDTRPLNSLINFAFESDLFVCEGMYGEDEKILKAVEKKHMTFSEAALLAKNANVKEMWLTHYSPSLQSPEDFIDSAKAVFGNIILGDNLMTKTLSFID